MIRVRLAVRRIFPDAAPVDRLRLASSPVVSVIAELDVSLAAICQLVDRANEGDGKIRVVGTRPVPMPSTGEEEEIVQAEVYGGSFLVFEQEARRLRADAGHPYLVLCQAARELGASGSRPLVFTVEVL